MHTYFIARNICSSIEQNEKEDYFLPFELLVVEISLAGI